MKPAALRTALLTGASGFLGSRLARRLAAEGWELHLLTQAGADDSALAGIPGKVTAHPHDGTVEQIVAILEAARPGVVFHLASLFLSQHRPGEIRPLVESNLTFPAQLLEAMAATGVGGLVNAATSWQHYRDRRYLPVNLYAATKQAFEDILAYYQAAFPLTAVHLALFDTYGPGDPRAKLVPLLAKCAREGTPLDMSPGEQLIDLVFVDDVVEAFFLAGERVRQGKARRREKWTVRTGHPLSVRELVNLFGKVTGSPLPVSWGARPYRPREVMSPWKEHRPLPGWRPEIGLEEGILRVLAASPEEGCP